jgi:alkanesulfonate monooxygenase SsuD/methylene tetrahydromethanopterin reductase-like flavin-dependent oxidoreductase (luciferase family)
MTAVSFGWRLPIWADDDTPAPRFAREAGQFLDAMAGRFDTIWVPDHVIPGQKWRPASAPTLEAWTTLVHFASAYPAYRFGHSVMNNGFRHPPLLAKMAATEQMLTGGRLILGIGAGLSEDENRAYGYDYPSNATRIRMLEECVQILRAMWSESPATFHGQYYQVEEAYCEPRPEPPPPLFIGGGGEQLTLRVVARHADWWNPQSGSPDAYAHKIDVLRRYCDEVGRDVGSIVMTQTLPCIALASSEAEALRIAEGSPMYRQAKGSVIVGTPQMVADHLRAYRELGITHFNVARFADAPRLDGALQFAEEVMPLLR